MMKIRLEKSLGEQIFLRFIATMAVLLVLLFLLQLADTDYSRNRTEHHRRIGIIYEDLSDPFWSATMQELKKGAHNAGLVLIMRDATMAGGKRQYSEVKELLASKVRILVVAAADSSVNSRSNSKQIELDKEQNELVRSSGAKVMYLTKPDGEAANPKKFAQDTLDRLSTLNTNPPRQKTAPLETDGEQRP